MLRGITLLVLCLSAGFAQIGTSTITGRVVDASGAVVPNVAITILQKTTNFTFQAVTNDDGIYRVLSLQPGAYRVTFEAGGFKKSVRDDIELRTGDTMAVDITMQVGQVSESVEVSGSTQLLETETSATGTLVSGDVLYDMPLYQRYVNSTLNLVPGMQTGGYAYGGDLGSYHLAGQRSGAIGIFEDGVNGNDQQSGTGTIKPLQNSVAEVKVLTTVPPAEYGHSAGGVINVVKKSGTNEFHGMGSWYGRTRSMQHRLFYDKFKTSQPTPTRPNGVPVFFMMPDANVSGPIVKNKTFFFIGYQRLHEKKVAQVDATTPSLEMKGGLFNWAGANPIFDPATTRLVNGAWQRNPFPGNVVPVARFDPVARNLLALDPWVAPNRAASYTATDPTSNLLADEYARVFFDDYNLRLDHQFNSNSKLYGSYTENRQNGLGRPINIKEDMGMFDASQGRDAPFHQRNVSAGHTWIARPTLINDVRVGYFRRYNETTIPGYNDNWAAKLGIPNVDGALVPGFGGSFGNNDRYNSNTLYGIFGNNPSKLVNETFSIRDDVSWIRGTHAVKFGYEWLRFRLNSAIPAQPVLFSFAGVTSGLQANGQAVPNTGNTFAGFLTGYASQATFRTELTSWLPRSSIHSFYIQDDWKITPTLTANIGLRYSNESPYSTKYNGQSNFDPTAVDPLTGRTGAIVHPSGGLNARDNNNFNPRIGLAWHPLEKVVLRGGFGFYTVDNKFPLLREQYDEYTATANQQANPGDPTPIYQISRGTPPPAFNTRPNGTSPYSGTNYGSRSVSWWDPNLRNPYVMNWNASAQYEFVRDYLLEVSYQGSSGVGLLERWQLNTFPIDFGAGNPTLQGQVFAAPQNYRPYTQMGDTSMRSNFGHSTFHSGTVKLEKRFSRGFYFSTFYTYSKAINSQDNDNIGGSYNNGVAPIQNRNLEKARAGYDRTHRWIGVVNYELPFGPGKKWLTGGGWKKWLFGGYEISFIQTLESGNPLTFSYANSPYNYYPTFAGTRRPDTLADPTYDFSKWNNGGPDRFPQNSRPAVVDINAFQWPSGCGQVTVSADPGRCNFQVGSLGRNTTTGPRLAWSQVSAQKNFRFSERFNAQLRWDFQNVFKTYNFTGPSVNVDFRNPATFGKLLDDPRTASLGGQPLMNLTVAFFF